MDLVRSLGRVEANLDLRSKQRANSSTGHPENRDQLGARVQSVDVAGVHRIRSLHAARERDARQPRILTGPRSSASLASRDEPDAHGVWWRRAFDAGSM